MNKPISILHLSDLHRSKNSPISNKALLSSLLADVEKFGSEPTSILEPNLIIVSGDIVRGSTNNDFDMAQQEVEDQYTEAEDFLNELTKNLLKGDKSRVVIIPGNHDISWIHSNKSMEVIPRDGTARYTSFLNEVIDVHSPIRWSWKDFSFYRIFDDQKYKERLKAFSDFYSRFYEGSRTYPLDPAEQFDIFDVPELNATIVGYNSCYNNDHLNRSGAINPECIASSSMLLGKYKKKGRLLLCTWHHNTKGSPYSNDYMDDRFIKNLIDSGYVLGLHGHQHKNEIIRQENNVIDKKQLLIVSSGTLCGGPNELPTGFTRQYNVIHVERSKEEVQITLHNREKTASSTFDNPIWVAGNIDSTLKSYFEYSVPNEIIEPDLTKVLADVEILIRKKENSDALEILMALDKENPFVRKFLLKSLDELDDSNGILENFGDPISSEEAIFALNACIELNNAQALNDLLTKSIISNSDDPSVIQIREQAKITVK